MEDLKYVVSGVKKTNTSYNRRKVITPVCIVVDKSASMSQKDGTGESRMELLNKGLNSLIQKLKQEETERKTTEIAIVSYRKEGKIEQPFKNISEVGAVSIDTSRNNNESLCGDLTRGIEKALDLIKKRTKEIKDAELTRKRPWIVIMSDGAATPENTRSETMKPFVDRMKKYMNELSSMLEKKELEVLTFLSKAKGAARYNKSCTELKSFIIGESAAKNGESTHRFVEIENLKGGFDEFFDKLSKSVSVGNTDIYQNAAEPKLNKRFMERFGNKAADTEREETVIPDMPDIDEAVIPDMPDIDEAVIPDMPDIEEKAFSSNILQEVEIEEIKDAFEENFVDEPIIESAQKARDYVYEISEPEKEEEDMPRERSTIDEDLKVEIIKPYDDNPDDWDDI